MGRTVGNERGIEGGIELRKGERSESIRIRFMYRGVECRETLKLAHTKANINYAKRFRGEILNAIERGTFKYHEFFPNSAAAKKFGYVPTNHTVGDLLRNYLKTAEKSLSPSTYRGYKQVSGSHLFKQWDKTLLVELKPPAIRSWLSYMTCTKKTIRNILCPLNNVLEIAVNDDLIEYNPLTRVKLDKIIAPEQKRSAFRVEPFTMEEITAILKACDGQERELFRFAFATGMRTSELIALEWSSIDMIHFTVGVDRVKVQGTVKEYGKTDKSIRSINMLKGAYDALKAQESMTRLAGGVVFMDERHKTPWKNDHVLRQRWDAILRKAKVRYRNPYQTRHTYASTLLSAGISDLYVAHQMGHVNTEMIKRHYGKWIEQGRDEQSRQQIQAFFAHVSPKFLGMGWEAA